VVWLDDSQIVQWTLRLASLKGRLCGVDSIGGIDTSCGNIGFRSIGTTFWSVVLLVFGYLRVTLRLWCLYTTQYMLLPWFMLCI